MSGAFFMIQLIVAIIVVCWTYNVAESHGRTVWKWVVLSLFIGIFAPIIIYCLGPKIKD